MDLREMYRVDPILVTIEKGAEAHGFALDGANRFVGDVITKDRDDLADMML